MLFNACKHSCVINAPYGNEEQIFVLKDVIIDLCTSCGISYALIIHDKDFNEDNSEKLIHIHLYLEGKTRIKSEWIISSIREFMVLKGYDFNANQFSDRKVVNDVTCLQYLIHKNDYDKYQYSINDVLSNDDRFLQKIEDGVINIDETKLISLVNTLSYHELLVELGIEYCRLNHNIIMHLYKLKRSSQWD